MKCLIKIFGVLLLVFTMFSCNNNAKTSFKPSDFVGKTYSMKNENTPAEMGGKQIFHFIDDKTLEYKMGDIMNMASYVIEGNKIKFTDKLLTVTKVLEIIDQKTLKDEYNAIWNAE